MLNQKSQANAKQPDPPRADADCPASHVYGFNSYNS